MNIANLNRTELRLMIALHEDQLRHLKGIESRDLNCRGCQHADKRDEITCDKWKMKHAGRSCKSWM